MKKIAIKSQFTYILFLIFALLPFMGFSFCDAHAAEPELSIYNIVPTSKQKILPETPVALFPLVGSKNDTIIIKACRGEFEPISFVLRSNINIDNVSIVPSNLIKSSGGLIPSSAVDVRLVKCWYQAGTSVAKGEKQFVPELLVKNDSLVKVDILNKKNYLKVIINEKEQYIDISSSDAIFPDNAKVYDSVTLLPFNLETNINKQVWVTFHLPDNAVFGDYTGSLSFDKEGVLLKKVDILLTVLPFELENPTVEYGLYYTSILRGNTEIPISSRNKSYDQYRAELQNMKDHGVLYQTMYQDLSVPSLVGNILEIKNSLGLPNDKIYTMALGPAPDFTDSLMRRLPGIISSWRNVISQYGFQDLYIYGQDEARGEELESQQAGWAVIHNEGAKVYVACYKGVADEIGSALDLPILSGAPKPEEVEKWHQLGKKVFIYGYPQVGNEDADIYRRNYGISLVCNGYDGEMNFAYQYGFEGGSQGHIWNDFASTSVYRNHVFAYPTSSGVIDTLQWEGFREAIDDVRYLTTLAKLTGSAVYQEICGTMRTDSDLDVIRNNIIARIISESIHLKSPSNLRVK